METLGAIHSTKIPTGPTGRKRTTSKGGPVFSKLFRLDRTDPLSFEPKFPEILVEWIAPIVADANVSQFSRAGNMSCGKEFAARKTKNVFARSHKHSCFPDTNFASETYVSQFSHPRKHNKKHYFRNNVS